jgi:predicted 3-demethylubiquinone-9 3-methyltransferase (glyoxalase superfamily)
MSKIAPCLWFDGEAEEAAKFYVSLHASTMSSET